MGGGDPMKQLIAIIIAGIALIFFIAAAGVPDWEHASGPFGSTLQAGAFRYCASNPSATNCYSIYPDCSIHGSSCSGSCGTISDSTVCNQIRAVQGFLVLAILFTAVVVIIMCVVRFANKDVNAIAVHVILAVIALCCIISFGVFINKLDPPPYVPFPGLSWTPGAGVALTIVGWILIMADAPLWHFATKGTA